MTQRSVIAAAVLIGAVATSVAPLRAADRWIEVRSAHFTLTSNAGDGTTRTLAWQLEQIRSAIATLWPWAKVDLNKPLTVFALKGEPSMKTMAPEYWERKGGVRPATLWVGGFDQNYLAIRADVEARDDLYINPYVTSYFSYVSLILQQSVERPLPLWFSRGLAGVMSNIIVQDAKLLLGPPIPWHLEQLRAGPRLRLSELLKVDRASREVLNGERLERFDAESWAFVHYLMFGESGARWPKLDRFATMIARGAAADVAFREALGSVEDLENPFTGYINRNLFSFRQVNVDVSVKREGFTSRPLSAAETAALQALFHAAMGRSAEARAAIAEARKAGDSPDAAVAEALLLDRESKKEEARAAYARAVEQQTTNPHAYYRLATLTWRDDMDHGTLVRLETLLDRAVSLNPRYAAAYALLGRTRSLLEKGEPLALVLRAIALEPSEAHHRLTAASVLSRQRNYDEALKHAQAGLALADTDDERHYATELVGHITRAKNGS